MKEHIKEEKVYVFDKKNYLILLFSLALVTIGYILMSGGNSVNPEVFLEEEIFSFTRITLAPILIMSGYVTAIYSILKK